jgi:hypothetical protein
MIVLVAVFALAIPAAAPGQSRVELKAKVNELRAKNRCLSERLGWNAGEAAAYRHAWFTAAGAISDFIVRDEPILVLSEGLIEASGRLNVELNRIGSKPDC